MKTATSAPASTAQHKAINPKHQTFITTYISTGNAQAAYQTAYPNAQGEAARAAASRLLARPEIANAISQAQQQARSTAVAALEVATTQHLQQEYASIAEKRAVLAKMIGGQWKRQRYINLRNRVELVTEDISDHALLRAIALDTKLAMMQEQLVAIEAKEATIETEEELTEEQIKCSIPFPAYGDKEAMRFWCNYHYGEGYYDKICTGDGTPSNPFRPTPNPPFNKREREAPPTVKNNAVPLANPQTINPKQTQPAPASSGIGRGNPIPPRNKT